MMNNVGLIGRLVRDPEVKKTTTNKSVVNYTVACERGFGDKKVVDFVSCIAWNAQADFIGNYLNKGSLVAVEENIQSRSYDDNSGKKVYVQEVLTRTIKSISTRSESESQQGSNPTTPDYSPQPTIQNDEPLLDITSDDLPF